MNSSLSIQIISMFNNKIFLLTTSELNNWTEFYALKGFNSNLKSTHWVRKFKATSVKIQQQYHVV